MGLAISRLDLRCMVKESKSASLLGMTKNKILDWSDHAAGLEKDLSQRTGLIYRLRNHLRRSALLQVLPGDFNSKVSYMMDAYADPTGLERGAGIMQQLQRRQNAAMRIGREEHMGSETLLAKSVMPSLVSMS
jgi:hypothetical protein